MVPLLLTQLFNPADHLAGLWTLSSEYISTASAIGPGADIIISPFEKSMDFLRRQWVAINWLQCVLFAATTGVMFALSNSPSNPEKL